MRTVPALAAALPLLGALALWLMPDPAAAQCTCTCLRGRSVPVCSGASLVQPICQQLCLDRVDQRLASPTVAGGSVGGGALGAPTQGLPGGLNAETARRLLGR